MATAKFPKSLGACADMLFDLREKRLAADKVAAELKQQEELLKVHIIDTLPKDSAGAFGKRYKVQIKMKRVPVVKDWPAFWAHVTKTKGFDMVQRRLTDTAVLDRLDNKKSVPGVEVFNTPTVSLTKV